MKKTLSSLLALLTLTASILTSCGGGSTTTNETTAQNTNDTDAPETTEAVTTSEYTKPEKGYDGAEFCFAAYSSDNYSWQAASYCDAWADEENGDPINDAIYQRNRAVEEAIDITVKAHEIDASGRNIAGELTKLILAGDDLVDVGFVLGAGMPTMTGTGDMVFDLKDIDTLDLTKSWWDQQSVEELAILDANYLVTGDISLYSNFAPNVNFINKQIAEDFSLENPYDLVRDGKWTFDKMIEMCKKVGGDVDGNGTLDINDRYGLACSAAMLVTMMTEADIFLTELDKDNVPTLTANTEKTVSFIEKMIPFLSAKPAVTVNTHYTGFKNVFSDVFVPMLSENRALFFNNQLLVAMNLRDMEADFGILPGPKYDENQENYIITSNSYWITFVTVPVTNPDLDMTGIVLDTMGYYSQQLVTPAYINTTVMNKTLRDEDSAEMLELILESRHYDLSHYYKWGGIDSIASSLQSAASTDWSSQYTAKEETIKAAIDATMAQIQGK